MIRDAKKLPGPWVGASRTARSLGAAIRRAADAEGSGPRAPRIARRVAATLALAVACVFSPSCGESESTTLKPEGDGGAVSAAPRDVLPAPAAETGEEPATRADGTPMPADPTAEALRRLRDPDRFRGRGSLRGALMLPGGLPSPKEWTISLSPSRTLAGREHAVERTATIAGAQGEPRTEFEIDDVPFGGYDVRAYTDGYASRPTSVTIEKTASRPYVTFSFEPLGTVRGALEDEEGRPLADVDVHLRLRRTGDVLSGRSRADGTWFFDGVETGAWSLVVGPLDAPEIAPVDFDNTGARSSNLGTQRLPVRALLRVSVQDESRHPVPDLEVVGYNDTGANVAGRTDAMGVFEARRVPLGNWKILARDGEGRSVRDMIEIETGDPETLYLTLPPR